MHSGRPGNPLHPCARAAACVCQPPRGARPGGPRRPLHLPDRPLFRGQEKTTVPPLTAAHLLDEGREPAPLTSSKSAFPPLGPAGPQTEMDGSGCLWKKKKPRDCAAKGSRVFRKGGDPASGCCWGGRRRKRKSVRQEDGRPHLSHPKELLEFPPL